MNRKIIFATVCLIVHCLVSGAFAEDKNGVRVIVTKKTLDRADGKAGYMQEIDRTMALKTAVKNISRADLPDGKITSVVLIRRWATETGSVERYTKEVKLDP